MRSGVLFLILAFCLFVLSCGSETARNSNSAAGPAPQAPKTKPSRDREPVLVELFTSEGCGNCPPADKQLALMETQQPIQGADVITLGYHVDYFNDRGWQDAYSSPEYTRRQNLYALRMNLDNVFTPQMIVDGQMQFVASDQTKAFDSISKAAAAGKAVVNVSVNGNTAEVTATGIGRHTVATAVLATVEDNLVSNVNAGNNRGKTLQHVSVVRKLQGFGKIPEQATEFKGAIELPTNREWRAENVRHVVYLQEDQSGRIIGVGRVNPS